MGWLRSAWRAIARNLVASVPELPATTDDASAAGYGGGTVTRDADWTGSKWSGGFGETLLYTTDYWTLRARSAQLFKTNLYARGIIRRLVTNEINTGLHLESMPDEKILGLGEGELSDWTELTENRFQLWCDEPELCDRQERQTFGALQAVARMEALVEGDVLVFLAQDQRTGLPRVQLISGSLVQTPLLEQPAAGNEIKHGVELDALGRQVAYWVRQKDGTTKRLPAWGEKSGRRISWLVYGVDKRHDDVRGEPLLALVLQALREVDRYRDATLRKAVINSMLAMFVKKTDAKLGTLPITGASVGAQRRGSASVAADQDTSGRRFKAAELIPGLILEELAPGEEPHGFPPTGTDEKFGEFERAVISAVAWAHEIPPEILWLAFSNNYSASQAAINEFKMYLDRARTLFGDQFCQPIYVEWLIAQVITEKVQANGFLEAWRDATQYDVYGAWIGSDWSGHTKPSTDILKQAKGYKLLVEEGWCSNDRASRELTGTKYSKNIKKLILENQQKVAAMQILWEAMAKAKAAGLPATDEDGQNDAGGEGPSDEGDTPQKEAA